MTASRFPAAGDAFVRAFLDGDAFACRRIQGWAADVVHYQYFHFDEQEIDDIVQDTVVAVWRLCSQDGFRVDGTLRPLVRRIASARCIDRLRRRRPTIEPDDQLPDNRSTPYDNLHAADVERALRVAVMSLRPECRTLFRWRMIEEVPYAEIARRQNCTETTVRVKVHQCLKKLRQFLQERSVID